MDDERALLEAWRTGDGRAGRLIYHLCFARLYRFFATRMADAQRIEELIHDTFMAALRPEARIETSLAAYLLGVARHKLADEYERAGRRPATDDDELESLVERAIGPHTDLERHRARKRLVKALRRLSLDLQIVLELYHIESMSAREVAEVIGVPEGTVRSRVRAAEQALAIELAKIGATGVDVTTTRQSLDEWASAVRAVEAPGAARA